MSTSTQEAKKGITKEVEDEEQKEEAEEILAETKTQKEQGKAMASVATSAGAGKELDANKVKQVAK